MPFPKRGCRNDRRLTAVCGALLLAALGAASDAAELGRPMPLAPAPRANTSAPPADPPIRAAPLPAIDAAWVGALEGARGFPAAMWQGTPRALVAAALPQLRPTTSPSLQELTRRLLLSNAVPPAGNEPGEEPGLLELRLERLLALGEIEGAQRLLEALGPRHPELDRDEISLRFALGDGDGGCRLVRDGITAHQGSWWDRALVACQALAGDHAQAALGLTLLREQKAKRDATFETLVEAVAGRPAKLDKLGEPDAIAITLLAAAKLPLPDATVATTDLAALRAWVGNEGVPVTGRLAAAERVAALGALPPDALAELYGKVAIKPDELGAAIKQGKMPTSPRDRALLFQLARNDPAPGIRAAALQALLVDAGKRGVFPLMARVVAPLLLELAPSDGEFAPFATRALLSLGRADLSAAWLEHVKAERAPLLASLTLLARSAVGGRLDVPSAGRIPGQETLFLTLAAAVDAGLAPGAWASLLAPPHTAEIPSAALWMAQRGAAAEKRLGETVLMSVLLARAGDHLATEPVILYQVITGLKAVGLESEARALTVEAALDAGI